MKPGDKIRFVGEIQCPTDLGATLEAISALIPAPSSSGFYQIRIRPACAGRPAPCPANAGDAGRTVAPWPSQTAQWTLLRQVLEGCWWRGIFPVFLTEHPPAAIPLPQMEVGSFLRASSDSSALWPYDHSEYFVRCRSAFLWARRLGQVWQEKIKSDDLWFRLTPDSAWQSACEWRVMPRRGDALRAKGKLPGLTTPRHLKLGGQVLFEIARMAPEWKGVDPHQLFEVLVQKTVDQGMQELIHQLPDTVSVIDAVGGKEVLSNKSYQATQPGRGYHREISVGAQTIHYHYPLDHLKDFVSKHVQSLKFGHLSRIGQMIVHELNNPLGGIYNLSQMMQMALTDPQKDQSVIDLLQKIEKQCKRAKEIIEHLSSYFGSTPTQDAAQESVEITQIFEEVQSLVKAVLRGTELTCSVAPEGIAILSHRVKLLHILVNLIINAAEAINDQPGGKIQLRAYSEADQQVIEVEDNGPGIPQALMSKILEPFFSTKGKNTPNSGLGLSLVKFFLDELGYRWTLESSQQRHETLFRILIPRGAEVRHNKPKAKSQETQAS